MSIQILPKLIDNSYVASSTRQASYMLPENEEQEEKKEKDSLWYVYVYVVTPPVFNPGFEVLLQNLKAGISASKELGEFVKER